MNTAVIKWPQAGELFTMNCTGNIFEHFSVIGSDFLIMQTHQMM